MRGELLRKSIHLLLGLAFAVAPFFVSREVILFACAGITLAATAVQYTAWILRYFELDRSTVGAVYVPIGVGVTAWYFLPDSLTAYVFGVLCLALADTAAALVGKWIGATRISFAHNRRTLEGTLAFFLVTMLLLVMLPVAATPGTLLVIAVLLTHVELFAPGQTDNIFIPLVGAALIQFLA